MSGARDRVVNELCIPLGPCEYLQKEKPITSL